MKKFVIQVILLMLVIGLGLVFFVANKNSKKVEVPFVAQNPTLAELKINGTTLKVEIADSVSKRAKGLAGKESLASDEGMLFIFDNEGSHPFWMKGLKFPLDFIWIKNNKVVEVMSNIPAPKTGQKDEDLPIYQSKEAVDKVLEVNGGTADRLQIKVGDTISLK